jgi:two-component system, chemotaxis family, sensor histidine kinase and response regulator PixL
VAHKHVRVYTHTSFPYLSLSAVLYPLSSIPYPLTMYIDPDLRDRVYQLFSLEVPKMLQTIETELVTLSVDRSVTKVHNLLRAAHSIKGGAASLGLEAIEDLAHQVEEIFRILSHPELPFDRQLERLLFQLYDCLARLVTSEIDRQVVPDRFHTQTQIVLANIDEEIGHFVIAGRQTPNGIISGADLTQSIFEVDVAQSLARLERVLLDPNCERIAVGEFRAQSEVFIGISQLVNLPGFNALAQATIDALDRHPDRPREICCFALVNFYQALEAVLTDNRAKCGQISPGFAFLLAEAPTSTLLSAIVSDADLFDLEQMFESDLTAIASDIDLFDLEQMFERDFSIDLLPSGARADLQELMLDWDILGNPQSTTDSYESIPQRDLDLFAPIVVPSRSPSTLDDVPHLGFDLIDIFDRPDRQSDDLVSLEFDLIELFDRPSQPSLSVLELTDPVNLHYDLIDLFDMPAGVNLPSGIHQRRVEILALVASLTHSFDNLPPIDPAAFAPPPPDSTPRRIKKSRPISLAPTPQLSVRVALDRLDRMNNVIGELAIERHGLALYNEQVRDNLHKMRSKCVKFQAIGDRLRQLADSLSISAPRSSATTTDRLPIASDLTEQFDALELDRYSELHGIAQATIEQLVQIEEQIEDLDLFSSQSERQIERQKQLLSYLRDDLMWARMLPLGEILNRFPRTLHDLSIEYQKPVDLKITGAGVLVDRSTIDKLLDPLLHLLRNAFDHGIEAPAIRRAAGKPERGSIEITAYHQGSQTVIEIRDDGGGIDLERIKAKAIALELPNASATATDSQILDFIFNPGFSTTDRVTKLSGRGMGLDIVKAQIQTIKGTIFIDSQLGRGTTFTLRIPLTLTIAQLMICQVGRAIYAFPADSIQRIVIPTSDLIEHREKQQYLQWQGASIPIYNLSDLLSYSVPIPERTISHTLKATIDNPLDWLAPLLMIRSGERYFALQIDRSISEQELTIVPFSKGITPPSYSYGCTILGDGAILPVIDLHTLIRVTIDRPHCAVNRPISPPQQMITRAAILVIDDSVTTRQSLCLSLEKFGYRTIQAKDGQEALQLMRQKASELKLAICDVEMPNMNGFEFLNVRRQEPTLMHIPVVMLTSRSSAKHRQFAAHLGAIDYFIKPYIERDFMAAIGELMRQQS